MRARLAPGVLFAAVALTASAALVAGPRPTAPDEVPLPSVDGPALAARAADDARLAREAHAQPLDDRLRALGSALRRLNAAQRAQEIVETDILDARRAIDDAIPAALAAGGPDGLRRLRAVQLETFLRELRLYEHTGRVSEELGAVGGTFVERLVAAGWVDRGGRLTLDDDERRVAYIFGWNAAAGIENVPALTPTLDEQRVLLGLYVRAPHPPDSALAQAREARRRARTPLECGFADAELRRATERWRLDKVQRLAQLDPTYPGEYALGVAAYRAGDPETAASHFEAWLRTHPDGPYGLRARAGLAAARGPHAELPATHPPR